MVYGKPTIIKNFIEQIELKLGSFRIFSEVQFAIFDIWKLML